VRKNKYLNEEKRYIFFRGTYMSLIIRPFDSEDLDKVCRIEESSFMEPWPATFFTYMHGKASDLFLVAVAEGTIYGYVLGEMRDIIFSGVPHRFKIGHILNIAVDTKLRRRMVGFRLMEEIENRFKNRGATKVTLEVRESNTAARAFYLRCGYEEIGRVRAYYPNEDAVVMNKTL
jgi:ribosomal-protein-alanine N-acetyltransferase